MHQVNKPSSVDPIQSNFMIGITGASGFVGNAVFASLESKEIRTRRFLRRVSYRPRTEDCITGAFNELIYWPEVLADLTCLVHCAAHVHQLDAHHSVSVSCPYFATNTYGTLNLARSAACAGVQRFVFLSSVKVLGECTSTHQVFQLGSEPQPHNAYGRSKWQAEQGLWQIAKETGLEVVIIRPPLVYGPSVKANFRQLLNWVANGIPLPLASINNLRSLVYLGNLVDLITVCIDHPDAPGHTFMVSDGHDLSTPELICQIAAAMGRSPRLFGMPEPWLRQAARMAGRLPQFERLTQNLQVDIEHTRSVLGWTPPYTVEQGMRETVDAFLQS